MSSYITKSTDDFLITSISDLRLHEIYWLIKVEVTKKFEIQTWMKDNKVQKFFKFNVKDETNAIHVTAFTDTVDKFFDLLQVCFYLEFPIEV